MIIKSLELQNFRNYETMEIHFDPATNIIFGDNAQGKTNILEACYLSGISKSHKGSHDKDMIRFGEKEAHIRTIIEKKGRDYQIDLHLRRNKTKGIAINQIPIKKATELFGYLNIIFFSPEDLNIIKNGPGERRRFIDVELCQLDKIYLSNLSNYNKILNNRNKLLKDIYFNPSLRSTLDVWDEQLISYGKKIIKRRREFIDEISGIVHDMHYKISGEKEDLQISYEPDVEDFLFVDELFRVKEKDLKFGTTSVGPHRDDLKFTISGVDIRKFGSQGQQRTCALSLKLSEIKIVEDTISDKPVLLLDDVLSELDSTRQNYLLNSLYDTQTIITCTGLDDFVKNRFEINKVFEVISGTVTERNE
ncbi:MAG: DNA replication/repair protein RecF [Lachnospiraceae bacterium]|nr:DNA replication/repair protein RecF [Lachnospiraceae bacterium]